MKIYVILHALLNLYSCVYTTTSWLKWEPLYTLLIPFLCILLSPRDFHSLEFYVYYSRACFSFFSYLNMYKYLILYYICVYTFYMYM